MSSFSNRVMGFSKVKCRVACHLPINKPVPRVGLPACLSWDWLEPGPGPRALRAMYRRTIATLAGTPLQLVIRRDFDGESARMGLESCLITAISPSYTAGHIASYGTAYRTSNATMRRLRNRPQNGAERRQPRWMLIQYPPLLLVRVVS